MFKFILTTLLFISSVIYSKELNYDLAVCAIFQDDSRYIPEWIEFHESRGVQHFYLYNNLSSDNYMQHLSHYVNDGLVTLIEWPYHSVDSVSWNTVQCNAYMDCINKTKTTCKWVAFLDTDEFLFSPKVQNLREMLWYFRNYSGVCVNWIMYGTSLVEKIGPDERMTDKLLFREKIKYDQERAIKSIVQPRYVTGCINPHFFLYIPSRHAVNEKKERVDMYSTPYISVNLFRINHYWQRDLEFFWNVKVKRQKKWWVYSDEKINELLNAYNNEYDDILSHYKN